MPFDSSNTTTGSNKFKKTQIDCIITIYGPALMNEPKLNGWPASLKVPQEFSFIQEKGWKVPKGTYSLEINSETFIKQSIVINSLKKPKLNCNAGYITQEFYPGNISVLNLEPTKKYNFKRGYQIVLNGSHYYFFTKSLGILGKSILYTSYVFLLVLFFIICGLGPKKTDLEIYFLFGFVGVGLIFGALHYFVTGYIAALLILVGIIIKYFLFFPIKIDLVGISKVFKISEIIVIFYSILVFACWNFSAVGLNQTDSTLYRFQLHNLLGLSYFSHPELGLGNGMRSLDWSYRSFFSLLPKTSPGSILVIWAVLLIYSCYKSFKVLINCKIVHGNKFLNSALSIVLFAGFIGLWMESYLTKFCFLAFAYIAISSGIAFLSEDISYESKLFLISINAMCCAWCLSIQPFSAFLILSIPILLLAKKQYDFLRVHIAFLLTGFIFTSFWMRNITLAINYARDAGGLNGIGRNIIWPNYKQSSILPNLLNLTSWHSNGTTRPITYANLEYLAIIERFFVKFNNIFALVFSIFLIYFLIYQFIMKFSRIDAYLKLSAFLIISNYLFFIIVLKNSFYILFSTFVSTLPILISIALLMFFNKQKLTKSYKYVVIVMLVLMSISSLREVSLYFRNPQGLISSASYLNYAAEAHNLNSDLGKMKFAVAKGEHSSWYESQVLVSELLAQNYENDCTNCTFDINGVLNISPVQRLSENTVVLVGNCPKNSFLERDYGPYGLCRKVS